MVAITLCPVYRSRVSTLSSSPGQEGWVSLPQHTTSVALSFPLPFTNFLADLHAVSVPRTPGQAALLALPTLRPCIVPEEQQLITVNVCLTPFGVPSSWQRRQQVTDECE